MAVIVLKEGDKIQKINAYGTVENEYVLTSDFKPHGGARSESATAVDKNGKLFFVKKLTNYVFATDEMRKRSEATEKQHQRALNYIKQQAEIYEKLESFARGGSLVVRDCTVIVGSFCYNIFPYIENQNVKVHDLPMEERLGILRLTAMGIQNLHRKGIIHADLKPQNVMFERSALGHYSSKIIDFDDSFFEGKTPSPAELIATEEYYSPELAIYYFSEGKKSFGVDASCITRKTDIFTLGVIFCNFLTGKLPTPCEIGKPIYGPIFEAVPKGKDLKSLSKIGILSIPKSDTKGNAIPERIQSIVNKMLLPWYEDRPSIVEVCNTLSMVGTQTPSKPKKQWKCECGAVNDLGCFRCGCGRIRPLNPKYVNE